MNRVIDTIISVWTELIGDALGVERQRVRRWQVRAVFDPLLRVRLIPNRGLPLPAVGEIRRKLGGRSPKHW